MSTQWKLMLEVQSSSKANTDSLAAALITDCEIDFSEDSFSIVIKRNDPDNAINRTQ